MITVTISGADTSSAITATDTGRSGYVVQDFNPGRPDRENTYAQSPHVDGAVLTGSRRALATIDLTLQVWGTSYADVMSKLTALDTNLDQWEYTVTVTPSTGTASTYTCLPANYTMSTSPERLRHHVATLSVQIPRQP